MAHLAGDLNSRRALTVSRERESEFDSTLKINNRCQVYFCVCVVHRVRLIFIYLLSLAVTATSERAQASIVAVAITLALVLLAVVAGFLLSGR